MGEIFYLRPHISEMISSFFMVLGLLLVFTFIKKPNHVFSSKMSRRIVGATLAGVSTTIGMITGLAIESGHSWGNPFFGAALGMQNTYRFFTNDGNLLLIGGLYVVFQLIGALLALSVFIVYIYAYNFFTRDNKRHIKVTEIFKWEQEPAPKIFVLDAIAALVVAFVVLGGSNFGGLPKAWAPSHTSVLTNALMAGAAIMLMITLFGERLIITLNPFAWVGAFTIKLTTSLYLDRKSITIKHLSREFFSPAAIFGAAAIAGLLTSLIISLPHTPVPE